MPRHKSRLSHVNIFYTIMEDNKKQRSNRKRARRETVKDNKKWKRNKTLKLQIFCAVFDCSNRADREKNKSNYRFPTIVKNNGKEDLTFSKVRRKKSLVQIFRKDLTERNLENTKMKIMLSASPSLFFFTQSSQCQIWKANTYSITTNGNWTWIASVGVVN